MPRKKAAPEGLPDFTDAFQDLPVKSLPADDRPVVTFIDKFLKFFFLWMFPLKVVPNHLTIARFFMTPFVLFLLYTQHYALGIPLFIIAAFTDALDGALARTRNQVTEWGKVYDPMADKLLIGLTALVMVPRYLGFDITFFIIFIEMVLIGTAYYLKNNSKREISANRWGKTKMVLQSVGLSLLLLYAVFGIPALLTAAEIVLYLGILFALVSLVTYGI